MYVHVRLTVCCWRESTDRVAPSNLAVQPLSCSSQQLSASHPDVLLTISAALTVMILLLDVINILQLVHVVSSVANAVPEKK